MIDLIVVSGSYNETNMHRKTWLKWGKPYACEDGFLAVNYQIEKPIKGACIPTEYDVNQRPDNDSATIVYVQINHQKVLSVDERDKSFTVDIKMSNIWVDPRIKTKLEDDTSYIKLVPDQILPRIWLPQLTATANLKKLTYVNDPFLFTELRFYQDNQVSATSTILNFTTEIRAHLYCDFHFERFPFDRQKCNCHSVSMDPEKFQMLLYDPKNQSLHSTKSYEAVGFVITISFRDEGNVVGFDIEMKRLLLPYFLQYYLPCFFIVIVSFISFIVPLTAIPGRVGLMVTQFLTLTNIFIHQIVSFEIVCLHHLCLIYFT